MYELWTFDFDYISKYSDSSLYFQGAYVFRENRRGNYKWSNSKKSSPLKPHSQMNRNLVGSFSGRSSIKIAHFVWSINKNGRLRHFLFLVGQFLENLFHWNCLACKNVHGRHWQFLVGSTYGRFWIKLPQNRMTDEQHRLSPLSL